jgi:CRISPR-associated endoribonuclease Cas6
MFFVMCCIISGEENMRVNLNIEHTSNSINSDYRIAVLALLKEAFKKSSPEFKNRLYDNGNKYKPFTFSLYLPSIKAGNQEKKIIRLSDKPIRLTFSSSDFEYIAHFINGIQGIKNFNLSIPVKIGKPYLLPQVNINVAQKVYYVNAALFHKYDDDGKRTGYAKYGECGFNSAVMRHVLAKTKRAMPGLGDDVLSEVTIEWGWWKTFNIIHYGGVISAGQGVFSLTAPKEIQQLLYDEGFGARTAQGFGMLEDGEHRIRG